MNENFSLQKGGLVLVHFSVENWMSFRDRIDFTMVSTLERQHRERLSILKKHGIKILPIVAIYGGNASGKTSFFKAFAFLRNLVINGAKLDIDAHIPIDPFLLDPESKGSATVFSISILVKEQIYEFSFSATKEKILEEKLSLVNKTSKKILYHRKEGKPNFPTAPTSLFKTGINRMNFAFENTRDNQLFLTNSIYQNIEEFRPVYNWFKESLQLISFNSRSNLIEQLVETQDSCCLMNKWLSQLDTGISRLYFEKKHFGTPPKQLARFLGNSLRNSNEKQSFFIIENGNLVTKKLVAAHKNINGEDVPMNMDQESDGTIRLMDLLPIFFEISKHDSNKTFIIDEIDKHLHPILMKKLLEIYLYNYSGTKRSQLIFTTHNIFYMEQALLRRDEIWITERNSNNNISKLFSLSEFKDIRYDKDIKKSYLENRFGGIPNIPHDTCFDENENNKNQNIN